jgi:hypothetical protein
MQHKFGECGNFDVCSKGSAFFFCAAMRESTAHSLEPVPLPGQTISIQRMNGIRVGQHGHKSRPEIDGKRTVKYPQTKVFVSFRMPAFKGKVETVDLREGVHYPTFAIESNIRLNIRSNLDEESMPEIYVSDRCAHF